MQAFWNKTVEGITVGVGAAMDYTGARKLPEDPKVNEAFEKLEFVEEHAKNLKKALVELSKTLTELSAAQTATSEEYVKAFENDEIEFKNHSLQLKTISEHCQVIASNEGSMKLDANVIRPIDDMLNDCIRLKEIFDQRKKDLILLENEEQKYKKAQKKGKVTQELESTLVQRRGMYQKDHSEFLRGVEQLEARKDNVFRTAMQTQQDIMKSLIDQMKQEYESSSSSLQIQPGEFQPLA